MGASERIALPALLISERVGTHEAMTFFRLIFTT